MNRNILSILGLSLMLAMSSCSSSTGEIGNVNIEHSSYRQDSRTKLCFALIGAKEGKDLFNESTSIGFTCVECTEEVLALIEKD